MSFQVCYVVQALDDGTFLGVRNGVSTHSRPKAAGIVIAEVVAG